MSCELPLELKSLPVLKVLHRNANRIQEFGGRKNELLRRVTPEHIPSNENLGST